MRRCVCVFVCRGWGGGVLIVNILLEWWRLTFFLLLFCSDFHIDLAKHTALWLPAAEQTGPSGDGKPDYVQIRAYSIPPRTIWIFFFPLPGFTQIERYADRHQLTRGNHNELKQWSRMRSLQAWCLIGLSNLYWMEGGGSANTKGNN